MFAWYLFIVYKAFSHMLLPPWLPPFSKTLCLSWLLWLLFPWGCVRYYIFGNHAEKHHFKTHLMWRSLKKKWSLSLVISLSFLNSNIPQASICIGLRFHWDSEAVKAIVFIWMSTSTFFCIFCNSLLACLMNWIFNAIHTPYCACVCAWTCVCMFLHLHRIGRKPSREPL